jgi:uncharacterized protein YdeI (YjbR/CyaY-like superfamily)
VEAHPSLIKLFKNQKAWEAWLKKNESASSGIWLRLGKKSASLKTVTYQEAVEVALCYGWIDGQSKAFDDESWLQRISPRGPKSIWSKINRSKALVLIKSGRMRPGGLAAIETAKKNGQWKGAYDSHRTATPPADLQKALNKNPGAKTFFASLDSQNRYAVLFRIQTAKKADTRKKKIEKLVEMLAKHEKLHTRG